MTMRAYGAGAAFALARALRAAGADPERAIDLARRAREMVVTASRHRRNEVAVIDEWLRTGGAEGDSTGPQ